MKLPIWFRCIFKHDWHFHPIVQDWFCNRCRKRKPDIGIKRSYNRRAP